MIRGGRVYGAKMFDTNINELQFFFLQSNAGVKQGKTVTLILGDGLPIIQRKHNSSQELSKRDLHYHRAFGAVFPSSFQRLSVFQCVPSKALLIQNAHSNAAN